MADDPKFDWWLFIVGILCGIGLGLWLGMVILMTMGAL